MKIKKILIIRLSALGDIAHSFPALKYLNSELEKNLGCQIDFLVYKNFQDMLFHLNFINKVHILEDKKISTIFKKIFQLKKENYDYIIDFQGLIKTSLISFLSKGKNIGFAKPREWLAGLLYRFKLKNYSIMQPGKHVVEHNLRLANFALSTIVNRETGEAVKSKDFTHKLRARLYKIQNPKKIILIPCTTWESKFWTIENWVDLVERLSSKFPSAKIYFTGVLKEKSYLEEIRYKLLPQSYQRTQLVLDKNLIGLRQFFMDADLVIGVDTGPLHLAADTLYNSHTAHLVGIYGPTSASRSGPYSFHAALKLTLYLARI